MDWVGFLCFLFLGCVVSWKVEKEADGGRVGLGWLVLFFFFGFDGFFVVFSSGFGSWFMVCSSFLMVVV